MFAYGTTQIKPLLNFAGAATSPLAGVHKWCALPTTRPRLSCADAEGRCQLQAKAGLLREKLNVTCSGCKGDYSTGQRATAHNAESGRKL